MIQTNTLEPHPTEAALEHGLDPDDWDAFRALLHRAVDDSVEWLRTVRDRPAWQAMPEPTRRLLATPAPWRGEDLEDVYREFRELVQPYALGNVHPRFWGWVPGSGTTGGILAELLKGTMNTIPAAFDECGRLLEQQVVSWMLEAFGMPASGSGILVSGGSTANFVGLAVARDTMATFDVRREGQSGASGRHIVYTSTKTHNSVDKAVQLLGLGRDSLHKIPVHQDHSMDVLSLVETIRRDRRSGLIPIAVAANAGTVDTGAIDDLAALADLCRSEGLWLHVDGAFGAIAALSPKLRPRLAGLELADSLAFDFHKWLHVQYSAACTLFREEQSHRAAFTVPAPYLSTLERGTGAQPSPSHEYGPELSREAKGLKVWMSLKEHGLAKFGQLVEQNVAQASYLGSLVEAESRLELLQAVSLNIVCYRYLPRRNSRWSPSDLDQLNRELLMRLQERGIAVPSQTTLEGRFALRVCITNHRSRRRDFRLLVRESLSIGREVEAEMADAPPATRVLSKADAPLEEARSAG